LQAGKKGYSSAAHLLTILYREGKGAVPADTAKYRYWYERWAETAAREGDFRAANRLAGFYTGSIDTEHNVEWPENPEKAVSLYQWAADSGDVHAQAQLGIIYLAGRCVEKDEKLAFQWFLKAADSKAPVVTAWAHLVVMYEQGIGTGKDGAEAKKFLDQIMDSKHNTAGTLHMIGQLYHQGNVLPRDDARAAHYYHMSSIRGKPEAQFHLGQLFWEGSGVPYSPINAYAWWSLARDNIFDSSLYPYPLIKAALNNADKSMTRSDKSAAKRKVKQLIKHYESMGIVEGKRMGSKLKKVFNF
jgi:TPR repeat protein